ncbi:MAG: 2-iminobutanoate/2-iminopropanoate deaminase [Bacteroidia bacterium]|nr:2-iminobutanoate/2-iminopropanoate deaminase [Bacteroidia bacterium]
MKNFAIFASMTKKIIQTDKAPAPIGPYSQAVLVNNMLYVSGQIAINPATGQLVLDNIIEETQQVMNNLKAILEEAGMDFSKVIKTTIFLKDMNQFASVNEVYGAFFKSDFPARETVQVAALPKFVNVEISVVASM